MFGLCVGVTLTDGVSGVNDGDLSEIIKEHEPLFFFLGGGGSMWQKSLGKCLEVRTREAKPLVP